MPEAFPTRIGADDQAVSWPARLVRGVEGRGFWLYAGAIVVIATVLRLPALSERSLWLDESYSIWFAALPLNELWGDVPRYETHPPAYYTVLKGWIVLFGDGEAAIRSLSVAAGVANVLLLAWAVRLFDLGAHGNRVALLGALLLAVNPSVIVYSQEARPYALQMLAATGAILAALQLASVGNADRAGTAGPSIVSTVMLGLCGGAMLWLHNTSLFIALGIWIGLGLAILCERAENRTRLLVHVVLAGILALVLWSPFVPTLIYQGQSVARTAFWVRAEIRHLWSGWSLVAGGVQLQTPVLIAVLFGLGALWQRARPTAVQFTAVLLLPISTVLTIHFLFRPIYIDRLFMWLASPLAMLAAIGLLQSHLFPLLRLTLAALIIGLSLTTYGQRPAMENWREIVESIASQSRSGDVVLALPSEIQPAIGYYSQKYPAFPTTIYVPGPFPYRKPGRVYVGNLGAPRLDPGDAVAITRATVAAPRIWLISRREDLYDPAGIARRAGGDGRIPTLRMENGPIVVTLFE